jgi:ArsR family transcriptional regulator
MRLKNFSLSYGTQIFKSMSEEARVRILHLLFKNGEMTISDLEHILDYTQTKTSRHITYLKNSNIINARKVDQWVFYSIREEVDDVLTQLFAYLNKDSVLLKDQEVFEILASNRELAINRIQARGYFA